MPSLPLPLAPLPMPPLRSRVAALLCTAAVLVAGVAPLDAQAARPVQGWSYGLRAEYREVAGGRPVREDPVLLARVRAHGDNARYEIVQGDGTFHAGEVVITTDGGRTLYALSPGTRTYREVSIAEHDHEVLDRRRLRATFVGFASTRPVSRPCGTLAGRATTCTEMSHSYRLGVRYLLLRIGGPVRQRFQVWTADDLPGVPNPYARYAAEMSTIGMRDAPEILRGTRESIDAMMRSMPLRLVLTREEGDEGKGPTKVKHHRVEVSDVRPAAVDAAAFEIPAGYTRQGR